MTGEFLYTAAEPVGRFECSHETLNRIHGLINAAILSNFKSVLTDCPHREKLGWLEVSHLLADSILYNYDGVRFYQKICRDMREAQLDNGMVPDIAPEFTVFSGGFRDSPEWGSACVVNPWVLWQTYGDRRALGRQLRDDEAVHRLPGLAGRRPRHRRLRAGRLVRRRAARARGPAN